MPSIRLDHIAIAPPRIADAPSVLVAGPGGVLEEAGVRLGIRLGQPSA